MNINQLDSFFTPHTMLLVVSSTQKPVRGYEKKMSWIQNEWQPVPWLSREGNELWQEPILVIIFFPQRSFLWNVQQTTNELDMLDSKIELASKEEYLHFAISVSGWKYCWKDYSWNYLFHQMIFFVKEQIWNVEFKDQSALKDIK